MNIKCKIKIKEPNFLADSRFKDGIIVELIGINVYSYTAFYTIVLPDGEILTTSTDEFKLVACSLNDQNSMQLLQE